MASFAPNDNFYWHKYDITKYGMRFLKAELDKYTLEFDLKNTAIKINEWRGEYKVIYNFSVKIDGEQLIVDEYLEEDDYPSFEIYSDFTAAFKLLEETAVDLFLNRREELYREEGGEKVQEKKMGTYSQSYFFACAEKVLKNYLFAEEFIGKYCKVKEVSDDKITTDFFTYEDYSEEDGDLILNGQLISYSYSYEEESGGVHFTIDCSYDKDKVNKQAIKIFYTDLTRKISEAFNVFYRD